MILDLSGCLSGSWLSFLGGGGLANLRLVSSTLFSSFVACHYMFAHQVIHRDLKLGNLFLNLNITPWSEIFEGYYYPY